MATEKKGILKQFKEFATRGNVIDMAVGVIIGGAFGKIVTSLVNDIIMPLIGLLTKSGKGVADLKWVIVQGSAAVVDAAGAELSPAITEAAVNYGLFLQNILDFLIIAVSIFLMVKAVNGLRTRMDTLGGKFRAQELAEEKKKAEEQAAAKAEEERLAAEKEAAKAAAEEAALMAQRDSAKLLEEIRDLLKSR